MRKRILFLFILIIFQFEGIAQVSFELPKITKLSTLPLSYNPNGTYSNIQLKLGIKNIKVYDENDFLIATLYDNLIPYNSGFCSNNYEYEVIQTKSFCLKEGMYIAIQYTVFGSYYIPKNKPCAQNKAFGTVHYFGQNTCAEDDAGLKRAFHGAISGSLVFDYDDIINNQKLEFPELQNSLNLYCNYDFNRIPLSFNVSMKVKNYNFEINSYSYQNYNIENELVEKNKFCGYSNAGDDKILLKCSKSGDGTHVNYSNWEVKINDGEFTEINNPIIVSNVDVYQSLVYEPIFIDPNPLSDDNSIPYENYTKYTFRRKEFTCSFGNTKIEYSDTVEVFAYRVIENVKITYKGPCLVNTKCANHINNQEVLSASLNGCPSSQRFSNFNGKITVDMSSLYSAPNSCGFRIELYKDEIDDIDGSDPDNNEDNENQYLEGCDYLYKVFEKWCYGDNPTVDFIGLDKGEYRVKILFLEGCNNSAWCNILMQCKPYISPPIFLNYINDHPLNLGNDKILCQDQIVTLVPDYQGYNSYQWLNKCRSDDIISTNSALQIYNGEGGLYKLSVIENSVVNGVTYQCNLVATVFVADMALPTIHYDKLNNVLGTSYADFRHNWTPITTAMKWESATEIEDFLNLHPYIAGRAGIYKPFKTYDYLDKREGSVLATPNLSKQSTPPDGIFNNMPMPMFSNPSFQVCFKDNWINNNAITTYNPSGYELQNKDILDIYSAVLYTFGGAQPLAIASNAKYNEIATENFEEYLAEVPNFAHQLNNTTGNFDYVSNIIEAKVPYFDEYDIKIGMGRYAIVTKNLPTFCTGRPFEAEVVAIPITTTTSEKIDENTNISMNTVLMANVCNTESGGIIRLDPGLPSFNPDKYNCTQWYGYLRIKKYKFYKAKTNNVLISNTKAHTGSKSLKIASINSEVEFAHNDIQLLGGKKYIFSCWIHTGSHEQLPPEKFFNIPAVRISFDGNDAFVCYPSGEIINGWQKVETIFTAPNNPQQIATTLFTIGGQDTYFDDVRIFPFNGNMQTYVYNPQTFRLEATLDQNNFATIYKYDDEGNLFSVKRETTKGIKTIQTSNSFVLPNKP